MMPSKLTPGVTAIMVLLMVLLFYQPSKGDIYKWVDAQGVVHFSDQPPARDGGVKEVEISPSAPPTTYVLPLQEKKISAEVPEQKKESEPDKQPRPSLPSGVELYVTSWCKYCKLARKYLTENRIPFSEYDIEKDSRAAKRRKELDPRPGVPLAVINGRIIIGFSEQSYAWALSQKP